MSNTKLYQNNENLYKRLKKLKNSLLGQSDKIITSETNKRLKAHFIKYAFNFFVAVQRDLLYNNKDVKLFDMLGINCI